MAKKRPSKLVFILNIGKRRNSSTFLGSDAQPGCHWSFCFIDKDTCRLVYCDSLGWPAPECLEDTIAPFLDKILDITEVREFFYAHDRSNNRVANYIYWDFSRVFQG